MLSETRTAARNILLDYALNVHEVYKGVKTTEEARQLMTLHEDETIDKLIEVLSEHDG